MTVRYESLYPEEKALLFVGNRLPSLWVYPPLALPEASTGDEGTEAPNTALSPVACHIHQRERDSRIWATKGSGNRTRRRQELCEAQKRRA